MSSRGIMLAGKAIAVVSFLFMLHSGYSAREYLLYSKSIGRQNLSLPVEIVLECLVALAVMTVALVVGVGELKPISYEAEMRRYSIDGMYSRPSFQVFNHRGRFLRPVKSDTLFEDRYAYGVPVKSSRHPELNSYILDANRGPCDVMVDIIDVDEKSIEAFVVEVDTVLGDYEPQHDIDLRGALIRLSTLEAPTEQELVTQMMEATANSSAGNGMYAPGQQQQQQQPGQFGAAPQEQKLDESNSTTLYVGNLDPLVTESALLQLFLKASPVMDIKIVTNKRPGGLNYAFIEFSRHEYAATALELMNGRRLFKREIRINWAFTSAGQVHEDTNNHFHIFVGDLSAEVNDQVLAKAFAVFPTVSDARVMWDMTSGKSRGYGFVAFRDRADAEKAIGQMNGEWLGSRAIRVNWANQKAATNKFVKHDYSASSTSINHQPLSYEVVRDQTAQYNTTVYVGNLTNYTSQEQLQALFQPYGFVMEFRMQPDRGFAFIKMDTHENAAMAITQINGSPVNGRPVKCSWGKDRVADPKAAFGALAAAAASNPAYSYPYVYGMPPPGQQYAVPPGATGQQPGQQPGQQQQQQAANPQQWNGFGYDNYAYYTNPNYAQHAQMMADPAVPGSMPAAGAHGSSPDYNGGY
ncbi:E3 ubiquitin-protein ligase pub1 [Coemansia aciculifera]|nr:E3 ubiquitin-protein ligase pub1 [Coemansia aciculifera]